MSLFTGEYFRIYPGRDRDFQNWSMIAQLIGAFICTILTAWVCDYYDLTLGHYMTKAWICIATTIISIPCCVAIFFVQENFWLSMSGVFVEYLLSTCWGQPAIGILSSVVDADIRGTAIGVFFFLISIFSIIAPHGFVAIQNHYGLPSNLIRLGFGGGSLPENRCTESAHPNERRLAEKAWERDRKKALVSFGLAEGREHILRLILKLRQ